MEDNKLEQDGERTPLNHHLKSNGKNEESYSTSLILKQKFKSKKNMFIFIISLIIIFILCKFNSKYNSLKEKVENLEQKISLLESQINPLVDNINNKKLGIAIVVQSLYGNGIGRYITVLSELLAKTGKYDVYLIVEQATIYDFPYYKEVTRIIQKKDEKEVVEWDKNHNIDIYILNNDVSTYLETYKSLGKKIIGIFHGVFFSCIFTNHISIYQQWYRFQFYDAFIQNIPDDYYVYKKSNFDNEVFIPNLYTFEHTKTPTSSLETKNVLIVGRIDDVIKGPEYGIKAFAEALKQVPDATLNIVSASYPKNIVNLIDELNIKSNVNFLGFSQNISEAYLNASILIVSSLSELKKQELIKQQEINKKKEEIRKEFTLKIENMKKWKIKINTN